MPIQSDYDKQHVSAITDMEYVCLVAQIALLGAIKPNIRAVSVEIVEEDVIVHGIFDGPFTDEEEDIIEVIATEILASLCPPSNVTTSVSSNVTTSVRQCDYPGPLEKRGEWVYMRYEPSPAARQPC